MTNFLKTFLFSAVKTDIVDDGNTDNMPGERTTKKEKEHKVFSLFYL